MGQKFLIDTCAFVKYLDNLFPPDAISFMDTLVDDDSNVSFITKIKLPDAIIAATAIANNFILLSDNDNDFLKVEPLGLKYMNPKNAF